MLPSGSRAVLNSIWSVSQALFLSVLPLTLLCCQVAQELYWTPSDLLAKRSSICFACDTLMLPSGSRAVLNSIWSVNRALFLSVLPVTLLCCQVAQELYWTPSDLLTERPFYLVLPVTLLCCQVAQELYWTPSDLLTERSFYLFCLWHSYAAKWLKSCTELHLIC